jgi:hypothetical protein
LDLCLLHGFDHVHLDLGYFSNKKGYHPHELLVGFYSVTTSALRHRYNCGGMLVLGFFSSLTVCDTAGTTVDFQTKPPHDNLGLILEAYGHQPVPKASAPPWKSVVHSGGTVGVIKHTFVPLESQSPTSQNHSAFKPLPLRFVDYVAYFPLLCKALLILSWCNSTKSSWC